MKRVLGVALVGLLGCADDPAPDDRFGAPGTPLPSSEMPTETGGKMDDPDKPDDPDGPDGADGADGPGEPDFGDDGAAGSDSGDPCPVGERGCACTDEGRCKLGLRCEAGTCAGCTDCDYCGNGSCGPTEDCDVCPADCAPCSTCEEQGTCG